MIARSDLTLAGNTRSVGSDPIASYICKRSSVYLVCCPDRKFIELQFVKIVLFTASILLDYQNQEYCC